MGSSISPVMALAILRALDREPMAKKQKPPADAKPPCPHCGLPYDSISTDTKFRVDLYLHESDRSVCRQLPGKMAERILL
jgi:hypothetical protein